MIAAGGGTFAILSFRKYSDIEGCKVLTTGSGGKCDFENADVRDAEGDKQAKHATVGWVVAGVGAAIATVGLIKGFVLTGNKEKVASRIRKRGPTDVVVAPIITDRSAGATLQLRW